MPSVRSSCGTASYSDLNTKVAVVTGGSRGIGLAVCRVLAANGVKVVMSGRDTATLKTAVDTIPSRDANVIGIPADCQNFRAIERMRERTEQTFGPSDILVACAGGFGSYTPTAQMTEKQWHNVLNLNLTTTFLTLKSFLPGMIERRRGSIITIAPSAARFLIEPSAASAAYAAAKAGVVMFSRRVAGEVGRYGIRVNCVAPGAVVTERVACQMSKEQKELAKQIPLGRLGTAEDVAWAVLFLASDSSSWLTGVTLDVAGGKIML